MRTTTLALPLDGPGVHDGPSTLVLVFAEPELGAAHAQIEAIRTAYPTSVLVGCSTSGHVVGEAVVDRGLAGIAIHFEHTQLRIASSRVGEAPDSTFAGASLADELRGGGLVAVLVLADGIVVNGSDLIAGLRGRLAPSVQVFGGMAGDQGRFERTWVLAGSEIGSGLVVGVGFYGHRIEVARGSQGGWEAFGPIRKVTASAGNRLFELDGKPALELYKSYLGDYAAELPASALHFPLAVQHPDRTQPFVRTILAVDEAEQCLVFAGDVPVGSEAWLMRATHEMLIDGAQMAAEQLVPRHGATPQAPQAPAAPQEAGPDAGSEAGVTLAISCVGRRLVLGERCEEELEAVRDVVGRDHPLVGFYSNGEFTDVDGIADLQNQTMTLASLREV